MSTHENAGCALWPGQSFRVLFGRKTEEKEETQNREPLCQPTGMFKVARRQNSEKGRRRGVARDKTRASYSKEKLKFRPRGNWTAIRCRITVLLGT